jgi:predicted nucleic acid-binding protein
MDVCCLNRPFDEQTQDKVRFEAEAVISILRRCDLGGYWSLVGSDIIDLEIAKSRDIYKMQKVKLLYGIATERVKCNAAIQSRAASLRDCGAKAFDSLHLASAEFANADVFLTTDAQLLNVAYRSDLKIRVANPLVYYMEVLRNEQSGN